MSRPATNEALSAYLDGELTEDEAATLERELGHNAELRAELDAIQRAVQLLRDHGSVSAPADFHTGVMAAAAAQAPKLTWWQWLRRPMGIPLEGLAIAAAAIAVLLLALPVARSPVTGPDIAPAVANPKMKTIGVDEEESNVPPSEPALAAPDPKTPVAPQKEDPIQTATPQGIADAPVGDAEQPVEGKVAQVAATNAAGQDDNPDDVVLRNPGFSYTVYTEDPDALIALIRTTEQNSGSLTGLDNKPLDDIEIPPAGRRVVVAHLPFSAIGGFHKELDKLGVVNRVKNDKLIKGDTVTVQVTVQMAGGAPKDGTVPPNASRKAYDMNEQSQEITERR